jgi:hypothetical protein
MRLIGLLRFGLVMTPLLTAACASGGDDEARRFIARMDSRAPDEQVPNWTHTRALMMREAPRIGGPAPDFTLATLDGTGAIGLSQWRGARPVVLIFGSWT